MKLEKNLKNVMKIIESSHSSYIENIKTEGIDFIKVRHGSFEVEFCISKRFNSDIEDIYAKEILKKLYGFLGFNFSSKVHFNVLSIEKMDEDFWNKNNDEENDTELMYDEFVEDIEEDEEE